MFARFSLQRSLVVLLAGGFAMLLVDTLLEHRDVYHRYPVSWTPPAMALVGLIALTAAAVAWSPGVRRVGVGVMVLSMLVGLAGVMFHDWERIAGQHGWLQELTPPILAPLAYTGIGFLALLALMPGWRDLVVEVEEGPKPAAA